MRFSVCIPTVRPNTVAEAVQSVLAQSFTDWELVVVGQGEEAVLRPVIERAAGGDPRVRYLHLPRRGLSIARNAAIEATTGEIIALIDDDCEARRDWLATLDDCFAKEPDVGLVGGSLLKPKRGLKLFAVCPTFEPPECLYDPVATGRNAPPGWGWVGGNFAVRRSVAEQVGPFDEWLGAGTVFAAAEDTDYMLRLERCGIKMRSTPRAVVYHKHGYRYGWRAVYDHKRNYARGNGALAAKLTLLGDERGQEWVQHNINQATVGRLVRRPHEVPTALLRLWYFMHSYRQCLSQYRAERADDEAGRARSVLIPVRGDS